MYKNSILATLTAAPFEYICHNTLQLAVFLQYQVIQLSMLSLSQAMEILRDIVLLGLLSTRQVVAVHQPIV